MIKNCSICGKQFEALRNKRFCSEACQREGKKRRLTKAKQNWRKKKIRKIIKAVEIISDTQNNRQSDFIAGFDIEGIETFRDLKFFLLRVIKKVLNQEITPRTAQVLSSLLKILSEVIEKEQLESKVSDLEEKVSGYFKITQ